MICIISLMTQYPFKLKIYTHSETAERLGIKNIPTKKNIQRLKSVHKHLTCKLLQAFGGRLVITSGFRNSVLNKEVGGSLNSQHVRGEAIDFEVLNMPNPTLFEWCKSHLPYDQLIIEGYDEKEGPSSGWVHCSYCKKGNRGMSFELPNKDGRKRVRDIDIERRKKEMEQRIKGMEQRIKREKELAIALAEKKKEVKPVKVVTQTKVSPRKKNVLYGLWYLVRWLLRFLSKNKKK